MMQGTGSKIQIIMFQPTASHGHIRDSSVRCTLTTWHSSNALHNQCIWRTTRHSSKLSSGTLQNSS